MPFDAARIPRSRAQLAGALGGGYEQIARGYAFLFGRPAMQPVNKLLMHLALRGQGYNNGGGIEGSGEARFIRRVAAYDPVLCIDIGANKGEYSEALLRLTGARVIAFEPLPKAFAAVQELGERYPGRLTAVNAGVGDADATMDLHYGAEDSEHASFSDEVQEIDYVGAGNVNVIAVQVVTLDSYLAGAGAVPQIDLIKIDTEGFEHEVIAGAARTIERYRPRFIQVEYNLHQLFRGQSLLSLSRLLPGYTPFQVLPHGSGLHRVDPKRPESNSYFFSNFAFVRDDLAGEL